MMTFTAREKQKCAEREVAQRQRVYDRLVSEKRMKPDKAAREIALMRSIAADYGAMADAEDEKMRMI